MFQENTLRSKCTELEYRYHRLEAILKDAENGKNCFTDKNLKRLLDYFLSALSEKLEEFNQQQAMLKQASNSEENIPALKSIIERWEKIEKYVKTQKPTLDLEIPQAKNESEKEIAALIISDIEKYFILDITLIQNETTNEQQHAGSQQISLTIDQLQSALKRHYQKNNQINRMFYPPLNIDGNYIHLAVIAENEQKENESQVKLLLENLKYFTSISIISENEQIEKKYSLEFPIENAKLNFSSSPEVSLVQSKIRNIKLQLEKLRDIEIETINNLQQIEKLRNVEINNLQRENISLVMKNLKITALKNRERPIVFTDFFEPKKSIAAEDILSKSSDGFLQENHVLVTGIAGVGKTTLGQYLSHQWSYSEQSDNFDLWRKQFSLLMVFPLRLLLTPSYVHSRKIVDIVHQYFLSANLFNQDKEKLDQLELFLTQEENAGHILWILDGYDEIAKPLREHSNLQELLKKWFLAKHLIITSRPYYLDELASEYGLNTTCKLQVIGFTDENIKHYVENFFDKLISAKKEQGEKLYYFLRNNPSVWGACHTPITLELICSAWERQPFSETTTSLTVSELYDKVIVGLLSRMLKKKSIDVTVLSDQDILDSCAKEIEFLEYWAMEGITQEKLVHSISKTLNFVSKKYFSNLSKQQQVAERANLVKNLLDVGLFKPLGEGERIVEQECYFPHRTFQEYFAARYLIQCFKENRLIDNKPVYEYILQNRYDASLELMWWFIAGILKNQEQYELLNQFFQILLEKTAYDILGIYQASLLLRCWDETRGYSLDPLITTTLQNIILSNLDLYLSYNIGNKAFLGRFRLSPFIFNQTWVHEKIVQYLDDASKAPKMLRIIVDIGLVTPKLIQALFSLAQKNTSFQAEVLSVILSLAFHENSLQEIIVNSVINDFFWRDRALQGDSLGAEDDNLKRAKLVELLSSALETHADANLKRLLLFCYRLNAKELSSLSTQISDILSTTTNREIKLIGLELLLQNRLLSQSLASYSILIDEHGALQYDFINMIVENKPHLSGTQCEFITQFLKTNWQQQDINDYFIKLTKQWINNDPISVTEIDILMPIFNQQPLSCSERLELIKKTKIISSDNEKYVLQALRQNDTLTNAITLCEIVPELTDAIIQELCQISDAKTTSLGLREKAINVLIKKPKTKSIVIEACKNCLNSIDENEIISGLRICNNISLDDMLKSKIISLFLAASNSWTLTVLSAKIITTFEENERRKFINNSLENLNTEQRWTLFITHSSWEKFLNTAEFSQYFYLHSLDAIQVEKHEIQNNFEEAKNIPNIMQFFTSSLKSAKNEIKKIASIEKITEVINRLSLDVLSFNKNITGIISLNVLKRSIFVIPCWFKETKTAVETIMIMKGVIEYLEVTKLNKVTIKEIESIISMVDTITDRMKFSENNSYGDRIRKLLSSLMNLGIDFESMQKLLACISPLVVIFQALDILSSRNILPYLTQTSIQLINGSWLLLLLKSTPLIDIINLYLLHKHEDLLSIIVLRLVNENKTLVIDHDKKVCLQGIHKEVSQYSVEKNLNLENKLQQAFFQFFPLVKTSNITSAQNLINTANNLSSASSSVLFVPVEKKLINSNKSSNCVIS